MKKIFFTILLFLPALMKAQTDSLKGDIKSVRERLIFLDSTVQNMKLFSTEGDYGHYGFSSPEFTFSRFNSWWFHTPWVHYLNYYRVYDTARNVMEETWYYKNNKVLASIRYHYDGRNKLIHKKENLDDSAYFADSYFYNPLGQLLSSISYSSFRPVMYDYQYYSYDDSNRLVEKRNFDRYGESFGEKYTYTNTGKIRQQISHSLFVWIRLDDKSSVQKKDKNGTDLLQEERIYDSSDNLVKVKYYTDNFNDRNKAVLHRSTSYRYDEKSRKTGEYYAMAPDTVEAFREYQYYENDLLKKERFIQIKGRKVLIEIDYFYDKDKNIERVQYTNGGKGSTLTFSYKFDQKHNWTEQLKTVDSRPMFLRKREMVYY